MPAQPKLSVLSGTSAELEALKKNNDIMKTLIDNIPSQSAAEKDLEDAEDTARASVF